jgi:uncharacterized repeat protein (TIGR01451 family)
MLRGILSMGKQKDSTRAREGARSEVPRAYVEFMNEGGVSMRFVRTARGVAFVAMFLAVTILVGGCCGKAPVKERPDSPVWSVEISPVEDTNPTKTQHTFVVTVYDRDGRPMPNVQVHWILARTGDAVGDVVAYDDQDLGEGNAKALTMKTDNQYAVSYTNEVPEVLHRGNRWVAEEARWTDFEVGQGQSWCTITSPVEGDSHMIAYVPAIKDGLRHKVFAIKHWQRVPHLTVEKTCIERIHVGLEFDYTITVTNDGEGPTPGDTMVMDNLPEGVVIVDGTSFPENLGELDPGESESMTFRVRADTPGNKVNMVEARAGEFVARADCSTLVYGSGIDLVKECQGVYQPGQAVPFSLRVMNTEHADLANVVVTDVLPAGLTFVEGNATVGNVTLGPDGQTVTWDGFGLARDGYADMSFTATAVEIGEYVNEAQAMAKVVGTKFTVDDKDSCTVSVLGIPNLTIRKECEAVNPVMEGDLTVLNRMDQAKHIITVQNSNVVAEDVVVVDTIPLGTDGDENIRYISSNPEGVYDAASHTVTWRLGTLQAEQTVQIEVIFRGVDVGPSVNTASVTAKDFEGAQDECRLYILGSPAFQQACVDVLDGRTDADNFTVNEEFYYVATVQNEGEADLAIDIVFTLTEELEMVGTTVGFIRSLESTAAPTSTLNVQALGGSKFKISGFSLAPGEQKWLRIPVIGRKVTAVDAAEIRIDLNWQLWYDGRLFPRKGKVTFGETSVIDPE